MATPQFKHPVGSHSLGQTSYHILEEAGIGLNSLTFGQGGTDPLLWVSTYSSLLNLFTKACASATGQMTVPGLGHLFPHSRLTRHQYIHCIMCTLY